MFPAIHDDVKYRNVADVQIKKKYICTICPAKSAVIAKLNTSKTNETREMRQTIYLLAKL